MPASTTTPVPGSTDRFHGRRVLVTGGASGIGRETAVLLAREGALVSVLDLNLDVAREVAAGISGHAFRCDVSAESDVNEAVQAATRAMDGLDGVVNAAGITSVAALAATDQSLWDRIIAVNLTGTFMVCRAAAPLLKGQLGAAIVNIGSAAALLPTTSAVSYAAAKGGVIVMSKALAGELAPGVRVNVICPGATETPMLVDALARVGSSPAKLDASMYALKRIGQVDELAKAIAFLLGPDATFITGAALAVDGGRSFH